MFAREVLITIFLLRPISDAYRVSKNEGESSKGAFSAFGEMLLNKCLELTIESVPACILQCFIWLIKPKEAGSYALVSIGASALTTGFASSMLSFDLDINAAKRKENPLFFGYIPEDNSKRQLCFGLMVVISTLHNLSRSFGLAILATVDKSMVLMVAIGEITFYLVYKIARNDFLAGWKLFEKSDGGAFHFFFSFVEHVITKVLADYTMMVHMRHPIALGGALFTANLIWAQLFPFAALYFYEGELADTMRSILIICFFSWLAALVAFFCIIDLQYLHTFFSTETGPQFNITRFKKSKKASVKFDAAFDKRTSYVKAIHEDIKQWVAENIEEWREERPEWFKVEMIPDEFLPVEVIEAEGGAKRRRSSVADSIREMVGQLVPRKGDMLPSDIRTDLHREKIGKWKSLAEEIYEAKSNNYKSNFIHVKRIFADNEELFAPLVEHCPVFKIILSHVLVDKFGFRVQKVDWKSDMKDWSEEDCRRVGCSFATFLRKRKTGDAAVGAWRLHYAQLNILFKEVVGFEEFITLIANKTLRDSVYGTVYRVGVGALFSIVDAGKDLLIYFIPSFSSKLVN